ncbi:MAG: hypothetical protein AAE983_03625 [Thermoplasmataceae archaeon]|jgi:MFS family permease
MNIKEKKVSTSSDRYNLLRFNVAKIIALSSFGPFEIYSLFYLSATSGGRITLGIVMVSALLLGIGFDPFLGRIIDYHHRKAIIFMILFSWVASLMVAFSIWTLYPESKEILIPALFVFLDFSGGAFFSVMRAFQQTITDRNLYGRSNALSEISGQLPSFIGASSAIPAILYIGVRYSLVISAMAILVPLLLLHGIRENYAPSQFFSNEKKAQGTLSFMRSHYKVVIFFYLLNFTFIIITLGNLLKPIFIVDALKGNSSSISLSEMTYAVFGSLTGVALSLTPIKFGLKHCYLFMALFSFGTFLIPFSPDFAFFLAFQSAHGIGNPGNRISRNTLIMNHVKPSDSGRFFASITLLSNISRLVLLSIFTLLVNITGAGPLIEVTGFLMIGAMLASFFIYLKTAEVRSAFSSGDQNPKMHLS